ncbi:MAG TPA: serine/threonine-protein kinase, partial [Chloroflexota bacterium]
GYRVLAHLRQGNELDVYDVWSEERQCRCVAKVLRLNRRDDSPARLRLLGEGRLLLGLAHPHIIRAYELVPRPLPVLIVETLTGETLGHLIASRRQRLPVAELVCLGLHLCSALHYLHNRGVLHLDLKPSNVVSERGLAKLLDFSIASAPGRYRRGMGTHLYMAPELAHGSPVSEATDVWGLGTVLYEAVTGQRPFPARGNDQSIERQPPGVRLSRRLPPAIASTIYGCLQPQPADRPRISDVTAVLRRQYAFLLPAIASTS